MNVVLEDMDYEAFDHDLKQAREVAAAAVADHGADYVEYYVFVT